MTIFVYSAFLYAFSSLMHIFVPEPVNLSPTTVFLTPDKDSIDLSKYKGKVVILNFWASWSKASRVENKNLVRIFQKNKPNPKVVFISVSLDTDETSWKQAIDEDELEWTGHYCDFRKYDSPIAKTYNVNTLPVMYLFNQSGKLVKTSSKVQDVEPDIDALLK